MFPRLNRGGRSRTDGSGAGPVEAMRRRTSQTPAGGVAPGRHERPAHPPAPGPASSLRSQLRAGLAVPVIRSGLSLMTGTVLTSGLGLIFWIVAANLYDAADFGVATTSIYTMMMLADVASLGLRSGLVRYLPLAGRASGPTIVWGYGLAAASAGLTGLGFLVGLDWWAPGLAELSRTSLSFAFFALATACWALFNLQDAVLVARRRAPWVPIENGLFGLAKIALLFPMAALSPRLGIFWAWTIPVFPIVVVVNVLIARTLRAESAARPAPNAGPDRPAPAESIAAESIQGEPVVAEPAVADPLAVDPPVVGPPLRAMLGFSLADWLSSLARLVSLVVVPLMVLAAEGDVRAGHFQAAWIIGFTVFTLSLNAAHALLAENSHEQHQERRNSVQAGLLSLALTAPITVVGVLAAPLVLLVYGPGFADNSSNLLRLLLLAALPNVVYQIHIGRLRSQGRMGAVIGYETALSASVVLVSWLLLPDLGIAGVGVAWLVGLTVLAGAALVRERATWAGTPPTDPPPAIASTTAGPAPSLVADR